MEMVVLMLRCRYAPRKLLICHALHGVKVGLCNVRQDHLGPTLSANTYL